MGTNRSKIYVRKKNKNEEVIRMITLPQSVTLERHERQVRDNTDNSLKNKKKPDALELARSIGVYGAFGRTLTDLHKQGR